METRVKERLVGAVILVALIVALVPEFLSGPQRTASTDGTAISEQPLRTYTIDLEEHGFPVEPVESGATESPEPLAEAPKPNSSDAAPSNKHGPSETRTATPSTAPATPRAPPTRRAEKPATEAALASGWAVQLGSFSNAENAERLASELKAKGYKAFVSRFESAGQRRLRVRVGPEQERARAEQLAERLRREGRQATVVTHP